MAAQLRLPLVVALGLPGLSACPRSADKAEGEHDSPGEGEGEGEGEGDSGDLGVVQSQDDIDRDVVLRYGFSLAVAGSAALSDSGSELQGELSYAYTYIDAGQTEYDCDLDIALSGVAYAGDCGGCDYAYAIDALVTRDDSAATCEPSATWTYIPDDGHSDLRWYWWDELYTTASVYDEETSTWVLAPITEQDVLQTGFTATGPYGAADYTTTKVYTGADVSRGYGDHTGSEFTWGYATSYYTTATGLNHYDYYAGYQGYGYSPPDDLGSLYLGGVYSGELDTDGAWMDAWQLDLSRGDTLYASGDTADADAACDLMFFVNGPEGHTALANDDGLACTYEPRAYACPTGHLTAPVSGTYTLYIGSWGHCAGSANRYDLYLSRDH